jgi:hypothetical protein
VNLGAARWLSSPRASSRGRFLKTSPRKVCVFLWELDADAPPAQLTSDDTPRLGSEERINHDAAFGAAGKHGRRDASEQARCWLSSEPSSATRRTASEVSRAF